MSDAPPDAPAPKPSVTKSPGRRRVGPPTRHIYARDWIEICNMAKEGVPIAKIAKSYRVAPSSIYRGLKKRGVTVGVYAKSSDELEGDKTRKEMVERIRKTRDDDYKFTDHLVRAIMKVKLDAERAGEPMSKHEKTIKTLKTALEAVKIGTDNKWKILGLDRENAEADKDLPELPIRQMTDEEVVAIRDRQKIEDALEEGDEGLPEDDEIVEGEDEDGEEYPEEDEGEEA